MPLFIDFFFERFLDPLMLLHPYDEWIDRGQTPLFLTPLNVFPVYLFPSYIPPQLVGCHLLFISYKARSDPACLKNGDFPIM